jgi:hypothetical protein
MRSRLALLSACVSALASLAPAPARADATFPGKIQTALGLSYTPPCNICHTSPAGFPAPTTEPFAQAMKSAGLIAPDPSNTLQTALSALEGAMQDSDCDGIPDIEQLKEGRDPNPPGEYIDGSGKTAPSDPGCSEPVSFGCGAQLAPSPVPWEGAALVVAGLGAALARRRGRSRLSVR